MTSRSRLSASLGSNMRFNQTLLSGLACFALLGCNDFDGDDLFDDDELSIDEDGVFVDGVFVDDVEFVAEYGGDEPFGGDVYAGSNGPNENHGNGNGNNGNGNGNGGGNNGGNNGGGGGNNGGGNNGNGGASGQWFDVVDNDGGNDVS